MVKVRCPKCGHQWDYQGSKIALLDRDHAVYIVCPLCHSSFNLKKHIVKEEVKIRGGQEESSSAHFFSFPPFKTAYRVYCSCDAFALAFSKIYHYAEDMKNAIRNKDIEEIYSIIKSCEDDVKAISDYERFLEEEINKHIINSFIDDHEFIDNLDEVFDEVIELNDYTIARQLYKSN